LKLICQNLGIPVYIISIECPVNPTLPPKIKRKHRNVLVNSVHTSKPICNIKRIGVSSDLDVASTFVQPHKYKKSDVAVILHTNGTTGIPKLVPLSHENILTSLKNTSNSFALTANDVAYLLMPLHHSHGLIGVFLSSFYAGSTVILPVTFEPNEFWKDLIHFKVILY